MTARENRTRAERRTTTTDHDLTLPGGESVSLMIADHDRTQTFLLLHGGAGPASVAAFGELLAGRERTRVLVPTHPGFDGTIHPDGVSTPRNLAQLYVAALDRLDLYDVTVIGNSLGGWVAAEIALLGSPRVSGVVLVDAVGAEVDGEPVTDVRTLTPGELAARSFADPSRLARLAGANAPSPELVQANAAALFTYGGPTMGDRTLLKRLRKLDLPVQVIWGAADQIVTPTYGRAVADAIPGASFTVLEDAGHLPQIEAPQQLLGLITDVHQLQR